VRSGVVRWTGRGLRSGQSHLSITKKQTEKVFLNSSMFLT